MPINKLPAGPQTPLWLQKLEWVIHPLEFMEKCAQEYGDIFTARVGPKSAPVVFISHPEAIKKIFTTDPKKLDAGKGNGMKLRLLGEQSLISLDGEAHQNQRKLLTPPFHGERMRSYGQIISEITQQETNRWPAKKYLNILHSMQAIALKVIVQVVLGENNKTSYAELHRILTERLQIANSSLSRTFLFFSVIQKDLGRLTPHAKLKKLEQEINQLIYTEIHQRHAELNPTATDILTLMMSARDQTGQPMSDIELRDELLTLLIAGQEPVAAALAWAFYWIHRHPQALQLLRQELTTIGNNFDINTLNKLPYLNAIISETLRLSPPVMIAFQRIVKSPIQIQGYQILPGTLIAPAIYLTHHRPDIYPNPKQFKPERFLEQEFSPYEYLPFGGGNRRCIGMALALFEMKIILAKILSSWQLTLVDEQIEAPVRQGLLIAPARGVRMRATPLN